MKERRNRNIVKLSKLGADLWNRKERKKMGLNEAWRVFPQGRKKES